MATSFGCLTLAGISGSAQAQTSTSISHQRGVSAYVPSGAQNPAPSLTSVAPQPSAPLIQPLTSPPPTPEQARASLRVALAYQVLRSPLTLSVENASLEKIAASVQKALVDGHSTPKMDIQVREPRPVLLSFAAKNSTVDEVLRSSGDLAGVQLWIFDDHFLLAPQKSLLPEEKKATEEGNALKAPTTSRERVSVVQSQQAALSSFVASEIKGLNGQGGNNQSNQVKFDQLSSESKAMLQVLLDGTKESFSQNAGLEANTLSTLAGFNLSNNTPVALASSPIRGDDISVQITFPNGSTRWSTSGRGSGFSTHSSPPDSASPSRPVPPFLDPSAGNS